MVNARARAHKLSLQYNQTYEFDKTEREQILNELLPHRAEGVYLQGPIYFYFGTNTTFGERSYANFNFTVLDICPVTIGKDVFIGPNVSLLTPLHPLCPIDRNLYFSNKKGYMTQHEYGAPITIGNDCWIAGNVTVWRRDNRRRLRNRRRQRSDERHSAKQPGCRQPVQSLATNYRSRPYEKPSRVVCRRRLRRSGKIAVTPKPKPPTTTTVRPKYNRPNTSNVFGRFFVV